MAAPKNDNTAVLLRLLSDADRRVIRHVYDSLSLPRDLTNLETDVADLIKLLKSASQVDGLLVPTGWLESLTRLQALITERRDDLGPLPRSIRGKRTGSRYGGQLEHALIGSLIQEFNPPVDRPALLLKICLLNRASIAAQSAQLPLRADMLRRASRPGTHGYDILRQMARVMEKGDSFGEAKNCLMACKSGSTNKTVRETAHAFLALLTDGPPSRKPGQKISPPPPFRGREQRLFAFNREPPEDGMRPRPRQVAVLTTGQSEGDTHSYEEHETQLYDRAEDVSPSELRTHPDAEKTERRYSNYRTATDNQRLPYAWDTLNPLEQVQVGSYLLGILKNPQSEMKAEAIGILCMLITGKRVDELMELPFGERTESDHFESQYTWKRQIEEPIDAYVPEEPAIDALLPTAESVALPIPDAIATGLEVMFEGAYGTFGEAIENIYAIPPNEYEARLRSFLSNIRIAGLKRITLGRIVRSLPTAMMQICGDKVLTHIMTGQGTDIPPSGVYYGHYSLERCIKVYREAVELMFGSPLYSQMDSVTYASVGARLAISDSCISDLVQQLRADIKEAGIDLRELHNRYTLYSYMLLSFGSGHRPVSDPHHDIDSFDLDRGLCLISDKAIDPSKACRIVALPRTAVDQVNAYVSHLRALSVKLSDRNRCLAEKIYAVTLPDGPRPLPLFFFLDERFEPVRLSRSELDIRLSPYWKLPPNSHRHAVYSYLAGVCHLPEYAEAHLGHAETGCQPLGPYSVLSVSALSKAITPNLDAHLKRLGWCVEPGLSVYRGRGFQDIEKRALLTTTETWGPSIREGQRTRRLAAESHRVDKIIEPYVRDPDGQIGFEQLDKIYKAVMAADSGSGQMYVYRYTILRRKLLSLRRKGFRTAIPGRLSRSRSEPLVHNLETLKDARTFSALRERFPIILAQRATNAPIFTVETRLAEILIAAILYDALLYPRAIDGIVHSWPIAVHRIEDVVWVDIDLNNGIGSAVIRRWLPAGISLALLLGLASRPTSGGAPDPVRLRAECSALLRALGLQYTDSNKRSARGGVSDVLTPLLRLGDQFWSTHLPSVLHQYALGNHLAPSLTSSSWFRLLTGERLALWDNGDVVVRERSFDQIEGLLLAPVKNPSHAAGRAFYKSLCDVVRLKGNPEKKRVRSSVSRKFIRDRVPALIKSAPDNVPAVARYLAAWALHMAEHGTQKTDTPARATIEKYLTSIGGLLIEYCHQDDFVLLDESSLTERYRLVIESSRHACKSDVVAYLRQFHAYVTAVAQIASVDWADIDPGGSEGLLSADTGLILRHEYDLALDIILKMEDTLPVTLTAALFLILGYHYGLRPEEVIRLRCQDIQINPDRIVLIVRPTVEGDTKSDNGIRQLPNTEPLTHEERSLVNQWLDHLAEMEIPPSAPIVQVRTELGYCPRERPAQIALYALRAATGDPGVHLRHLRHNLGTRLAAVMLSDALDGNPQLGVPCDTVMRRLGRQIDSGSVRRILLGREEPSRRAMYAVGLALGHSRPAMSLTSYIHLMDMQLADCCHHQAGTGFSDTAMSYAHGLTENNYRVRKHRGRGEFRSGVFVTGVNTIQEMRLPVQQFTGEHSVTALRPNNRLTIVDVDRMLCRIARQGGRITGVAQAFLVDERTVSGIVESASRLQVSSCYDEFRVPEEAPVDYLHDWPSSSFRRETRRARAFMGNLLDRMGHAKSDGVKSCRMLVSVWAEAHRPKSRHIVLPDISTLSRLKEGLSVLGISDEDLEIILPARQDQVPVDFEDNGDITVRHSGKLPPLADKRRFRQPSRVAIGKCRGADIRMYAGTLHRILFVLGVWLESQNQTAQA